MYRSTTAVLWLILASSIAHAEIQPPVTGYVKDSRTGALRAINGLPGSSMLGEAIPLPFVIDQVQVCAANDFALALEANDAKSVWLIRGFKRGKLTAMRLDGAAADLRPPAGSGSPRGSEDP